MAKMTEGVWKPRILDDAICERSLIQGFNNHDWNNLVYDVLDVGVAVHNLVNSQEESLI